MKISFISKLRFPEERGVAAADMSVCRSFVEIGQKVELLIPNREPKITENIWNFYQFKENLFPITKLFCIEILISHLHFFVMSWTFSIRAWFYLWYHHRPYIHLFNECRELGILLLISALFYKPWIVYEVHDLPANLYEQFLENIMLKQVNLILTTTERFKKYYEKNNKVLVYPNGVFLEDFDYKTPKRVIRKRLKLPLERKIVGYAGRFLTTGMEKGIPDLIQAVGLLKKKKFDIYLACVGGPASCIAYYKKLAIKEGLNSNDFVFLDRVPVKTLYLFMRAFDVCAMPFPWNNHFAYNMSPLKMFEYMASGNPLVASDLPIVNEVLVNGVNCLLVKPSKSKDLANGLEQILTNKKKAKLIAANALKELKSKYLWKQRAQNEVKLYLNYLRSDD